MSQTRAELLKLSKDSLIKLAIVKIDEPSFDVNQFDQISVWAVRGEVWVYFDRFIKFIPSNTGSYYEAKVNLSKNAWTTGALGLGGIGEEKFYSTSARDIEKSNFVIARILADGLPQSYLDKIRKDGEIMIQEEKTFYSVSISEAPELTLFYKVRKKTGEVFDKSEMSTRMDDDSSTAVRIH